MFAALGPKGPAAIQPHHSSARSGDRRLRQWLHQTQRRTPTTFLRATPHSADEADAQHPSSTAHSPNTPLTASAELSEAEAARRKKISEANSGRVPWNKGRKHSPETIAKIKARTEEAMQRPEIQQNFRMAMEKRQQVHSEETKAKIAAKVRDYIEQKRISEGLPPKPPKAPKAPKSETGKQAPKRQRKPRPAAGEEGEGASADGAAEGSAEQQPKKPRVRKPKAVALNEDGTPADPPKRKQRTHNSEAHKQAIRDAIKAKWADPEYHQYMRQKMKEGMMKRAAEPSSGDAQREPRTKKASARSSSSNSSSSLSESKQQQQVWLLHVQTLVDQLFHSRQVLQDYDLNMERMQVEAGAFVNDPMMLERLSALKETIGVRRHALACRVAEAQAKIPDNVGFDDHGRVYVKRKTAKSSSPGPVPESSASVANSGAADGSSDSADASCSGGGEGGEGGAEEELSALSSKLGNQGAFYRLSADVEVAATIRVNWDMAGPELREAVGRPS